MIVHYIVAADSSFRPANNKKVWSQCFLNGGSGKAVNSKTILHTRMDAAQSAPNAHNGWWVTANPEFVEIYQISIQGESIHFHLICLPDRWPSSTNIRINLDKQNASVHFSAWDYTWHNRPLPQTNTKRQTTTPRYPTHRYLIGTGGILLENSFCCQIEDLF